MGNATRQQRFDAAKAILTKNGPLHRGHLLIELFRQFGRNNENYLLQPCYDDATSGRTDRVFDKTTRVYSLKGAVNEGNLSGYNAMRKTEKEYRAAYEEAIRQYEGSQPVNTTVQNAIAVNGTLNEVNDLVAEMLMNENIALEQRLADAREVIAKLRANMVLPLGPGETVITEPPAAPVMTEAEKVVAQIKKGRK